MENPVIPGARAWDAYPVLFGFRPWNWSMGWIGIAPRNERDLAMANDEPYDFFPIEKLRKIFSQIGVKPGKHVITYCGKAEAACSVFLALKMAGIEDAAVYDGSLAEWSRDLSLPMVISEKNDK